MKMNLMIATAILAWCEAVDAAPRPQGPGLVPFVLTAGSVALAKPLVPGIPLPRITIPAGVLPSAPPVVAAPPVGLPLPPPFGIPPVPIGIPPAPIGIPPVPIGIPPIPIGIPPVPIPVLSPVPILPVPSIIPNLLSPLSKLPLQLPTPAVVPGLGPIPLPTDPTSVLSYVNVGKVVLNNLLDLISKAANIPNLNLPVPVVPSVPTSIVPSIPAISVPPVVSIPSVVPVPSLVPAPSVAPVSNSTFAIVAAPALEKRQIPALSSPRPATPTPAVGGGLLGGLTGGLTSGLTGSGSLLGGLTSGLTGGSSPVGVVASVIAPVASVVGGVVAPVASVVGGVVPPVASVVGGVVPPVASVVGGVVAPVASVVGGVVAPVASVVGGVVPPIASPVSSVTAVNPAVLSPYPIAPGIPGTDPIGSLAISIIATLLSLLKKDPLSLFGGGLGGTSALIRRDLPDLAGQFEIEKRSLSHAHRKRHQSHAHKKRQSLPTLSNGVPGVDIGSLPLSGVPGISPDLAFLVGSIAKNIAVPGGKGLGSVTSGILQVLNSVVPNFIFKLPVVQDSVAAFGCLELLATINPAKFGTLADLNSLSSVAQAASSITGPDLAFVNSLAVSSDPSNLITTIMTLTDNILSLAGNVVSLKSAVAVLILKSLGLFVPRA